MDNAYQLLPWKKARKKRFSSVKAPSRSVSSLDDMSDETRSGYGSTTSLPTLPYDDLSPSGEMQPALSSTDIHHEPLTRSSSTDIRQHQRLGSPSGTDDDKSYGSHHDDSTELNTSSNENSRDDSLNDASKSDSIVSNSSDGVPRKQKESVNDDVFSENRPNIQSPVELQQPETRQKHRKEDDAANKPQNNSESDTVNYGNNIIILNNVGVENANEYDRLHPRKEDNELALLLQELNALINTLPENRRIGTPFSCANFVAARLDHRGGRIRLPDPDVCLCVPPGAIPLEKVETVYMYIVNPRLPALSELGDEDHWLTPIVHCGPPGINFRSYVSLSLPSSVADESNWDFTVSRGVQPEYTEWESLENRDDSVVLVKSGRINVLVDHFTPYGAKGKPNSGETVAKWMEAGVFVHPPCGETGEHEVQFHVRIWNIGDRQRVLREERKLLRTCLTEPIRAIRVYDTGCPVQVLVDEVRPLWVLWNHTGKSTSIPFHNLWREHQGPTIPDSPSITFVAQAGRDHLSEWHRGAFRCTVRLFQEGHDSDGISFIVRANSVKMGPAGFRDGQLRDGYGSTYLRQQPHIDPYDDSAIPSALFPLSEDHFHEVCLQLDGTPDENGQKIWHAFARTADLTRKEVEYIKRCAQQHQHKSPSDMLLTYFIGDPCRGFDTLRTLQEIWYVLYHIGNDGAREEVEEEMYERMTTMKGRKKERQHSDASSGMDHPSDLSSLVMTSDEQMSDLEDDFAKGAPLESTAVADRTLTEPGVDVEDEKPQKEVLPTAKETNQPPNPLEEFIQSSNELALHSEPPGQDIALTSDPSQLQEPSTDISDDLELQLSEFSKHWAVSEDGLSSGSDLSPSSEAELLKILLANDAPTQLTEDDMLSLDDPQRQELPLEFQPIQSKQSQELESGKPADIADDDNGSESNIVIYMDDGTVVDFKPKGSSSNEPNKVAENPVAPMEATTQESQRHVEEDVVPKANDSPASPHNMSTESEISIDVFSSSSDGHHATHDDHLTREYTDGDIEDLTDDDQLAEASSDVKSSKGPPVDDKATSEIPDGELKGKNPNVLKINITAPHVNGNVHPKSPKATRIAYKTVDIDDPHGNANNHNNVNHQNGSSTVPMTNGTAEEGSEKRNGLVNVSEASKNRRNSPKSPKQEDRECLRQLARLALTGKSDDAHSRASSRSSNSSQPSNFDFSMLQPVRNKEEEFV